MLESLMSSPKLTGDHVKSLILGAVSGTCMSQEAPSTSSSQPFIRTCDYKLSVENDDRAGNASTDTPSAMQPD